MKRAGWRLAVGRHGSPNGYIGIAKKGVQLAGSSAVAGERGIGQIARRLAVERGDLDAAHRAVRYIRRQRVALVVARDSRLRQPGGDKQIVGLRLGQRVASRRQGARDGILLGHSLRHLDPCREKRVQRSPDIDAEVAIEMGDGLDPLRVGLAEPDREEAFQPRLTRPQRRVGFVAQCLAQSREMRRLGVALDGRERRCAVDRRRVVELEPHQRGADQPANSGVRL